MSVSRPSRSKVSKAMEALPRGPRGKLMAGREERTCVRFKVPLAPRPVKERMESIA